MLWNILAHLKYTVFKVFPDYRASFIHSKIYIFFLLSSKIYLMKLYKYINMCTSKSVELLSDKIFQLLNGVGRNLPWLAFTALWANLSLRISQTNAAQFTHLPYNEALQLHIKLVLH